VRLQNDEDDEGNRRKAQGAEKAAGRERNAEPDQQDHHQQTFEFLRISVHLPVVLMAVVRGT
jgi:hypothetical protein